MKISNNKHVSWVNWFPYSTLKHWILCLLQEPLSQFGSYEVENVKILPADRQRDKWKTGNKKH